MSLSDLGRIAYNFLKIPLTALFFIVHSALFVYLALTLGIFFWLFFAAEFFGVLMIARIIVKRRGGVKD